MSDTNAIPAARESGATRHGKPADGGGPTPEFLHTLSPRRQTSLSVAFRGGSYRVPSWRPLLTQASGAAGSQRTMVRRALHKHNTLTRGRDAPSNAHPAARTCRRVSRTRTANALERLRLGHEPQRRDSLPVFSHLISCRSPPTNGSRQELRYRGFRWCSARQPDSSRHGCGPVRAGAEPGEKPHDVRSSDDHKSGPMERNVKNSALREAIGISSPASRC